VTSRGYFKRLSYKGGRSARIFRAVQTNKPWEMERTSRRPISILRKRLFDFQFWKTFEINSFWNSAVWLHSTRIGFQMEKSGLVTKFMNLTVFSKQLKTNVGKYAFCLRPVFVVFYDRLKTQKGPRSIIVNFSFSQPFSMNSTFFHVCFQWVLCSNVTKFVSTWIDAPRW